MSLLSSGGVAGNMTALQAYETSTLGLSFGGAGFLIYYFVGVLKVLMQLGVVNKNTKLAGISSGALTAGAVCSGMSEHMLLKTVTDLTNACRQASCAGRMDRAVRDLLQRSLPANAAQRCNGRLITGVTVLQDGRPTSITAGDTAAGDKFSDRSDLIETLAASAYIPIWSGRGMFTSWRGKDTADGSISTRQLCPQGTGYCLRIASRPVEVPKPTMSETLSAIARSLAGSDLGALGFGGGEKLPLPQLPGKAVPEKFKALQERGLDIAPTLSLPGSDVFDGPTWTQMGLTPCDPATCDWLYQIGQRDAWAWADATGIAAAAAKKFREQAQVPAPTPVVQQGRK